MLLKVHTAEILSLLRMPISPLRLRAQLQKRNTFGMNQSTGLKASSFLTRNSHFLGHWLLFWVLTASNCFNAARKIVSFFR
jgi:hypothetical protein